MASVIGGNHDGFGNTKYSLEHQSFVYKYVLERFVELENKLKNAEENFSMPTESLELIVLITDSFSKLLGLSEEHKPIKNLVSYLLPDIRKTSATEDDKHYHNGTSNNISYICDVCDHSITIINQDLEFSIEHHNQSPHHKKTEALFKEVRTISQCKRSAEENENQIQTNDGFSKADDDAGVKNKADTSFTESGHKSKSRNRKYKNKNTNETASVILNDHGTSAAAFSFAYDTKKAAPKVIDNKEPSSSERNCSFSFEPDCNTLHSHGHNDHNKSYEQANRNLPETTAPISYDPANAKKPIYECDIEITVAWDSARSIRYCFPCNKLCGFNDTFVKHIDSSDHLNNVKQLQTTIQLMLLRLQKHAETTPGMKGDKIRYCFVCDIIFPTQHKCIYSLQANRRRLVLGLARRFLRCNSIPEIRDLYAIPLVDQDGAAECRLCGIVFPEKRQLLTHVHDVQHKSQIWQLKYFLDKADKADGFVN